VRGRSPALITKQPGPIDRSRKGGDEVESIASTAGVDSRANIEGGEILSRVASRTIAGSLERTVLPLLFWTVFGVLFVASCAWVLGVFRLLRALKATRPEVHRRILAPVPWSWTVLYNPVAIGRVIAFVLLRRYDNVCDAKVAGVRSSLRRTLTVLALGWPLLIVLLLAAGPERFAA